MKFSLKGFIQSGCIGPIGLGASRESVERCLGPPDDFSVENLRKNRKPKILKYGGVEFYFSEDDDHVEMIYIDDFDRTSALIDLWILNDDLLLTEMERELRDENIEYKKVDAPNLPGDIYLITEAGVNFHFHEDEGKAPKLVAIRKN